MPPIPPVSLQLLPGRLLVIVIVRVGHAASMLFASPHRFLETLKAARDLAGFAEVQREDERLDELLPWTGNV